MKKENMIQTKI